MQTTFTEKQLLDPRIDEANGILRSCVHCGLCTATCPTYVLNGDERDSPRGRIYLIKDMFEKNRAAGAEVKNHVDRCLSCLSCMTTCPSNVDYMHLVDLARSHIHETGSRSIKDKLLRRFLASVLPHPGRFRAALIAGFAAKPFRRVFTRLGFNAIPTMLALAPSPFALMRWPSRRRDPVREKFSGRVVLLKGCAQQVLRPEINVCTERLLARIGMEVITPAGTGCCGALVNHMGRDGEGQVQAVRNVDTWIRVDQAAPLDAVIVNASGCGTTVKDYGHKLSRYRGGQYAERAAHIASITRDITEFLVGYDLGAPLRWSSLRVAYHSACAMEHGQHVIDQPRKLLRRAGFAIAEIPEGHICCGSAGVYNILQPKIATELRDRKLANIALTRPDIIATGNIGCITQLQAGTNIPVVHTIELLDWAYGGPIPRGLEKLRDRIRDVPEAAVQPDFPSE